MNTRLPGTDSYGLSGFDIEKRKTRYGHGLEHLVLLGNVPQDVTAEEIRVWFKGLNITDLKILPPGTTGEVSPGVECILGAIVEFRDLDATDNILGAEEVEVSFRGKRGRVRAYKLGPNNFDKLQHIFQIPPAVVPPVWTRRTNVVLLTVSHLDPNRWVYSVGVMPLSGEEIRSTDINTRYIATTLDGLVFSTELGDVEIIESRLPREVLSSFSSAKRSPVSTAKELRRTLDMNKDGIGWDIIVCLRYNRQAVEDFLRLIGVSDIKLINLTTACNMLAARYVVDPGMDDLKKAHKILFEDCSELTKEVYRAISSEIENKGELEETRLTKLRTELGKKDVLAMIRHMGRFIHSFLVEKSRECKEIYERSSRGKIQLAADMSYLERNEEMAEVARERARRLYGDVVPRKVSSPLRQEERSTTTSQTPKTTAEKMGHKVTLVTRSPSSLPSPPRKKEPNLSMALHEYQTLHKKPLHRDPNEFSFL